MNESHDKVGTNDVCETCGKWKGPMHTCPVMMDEYCPSCGMPIPTGMSHACDGPHGGNVIHGEMERDVELRKAISPLQQLCDDQAKKLAAIHKICAATNKEPH